ncbi:hypothetical protein VNI00_013743 [Paramarasmius palmivorus]|uniref:Terpene synthase n=1 Tax=Paramarasmius palmivorus TaxID=297713 RepID=A0AAW0BY86_9AGAR
MNSITPTFMLPDLEGMFSVLPGGTNPHYEATRQEARHWIAHYNRLTFGPMMTGFLENCDFELLSCYAYPQLDKEGLRATMDWVGSSTSLAMGTANVSQVNILWYVDEVTDTETGKDAGRTADVVCRTLQEPDYDDGTTLCRLIADFRNNHLARAGPEATRRFLKHCKQTFFTFSKEAELRERSEVLSIRDYLTLRKETSAVRTAFDLSECLMGVDLPEVVYNMDSFRKGYEASMDLIYLANDLYSYDMEQAKGHSGANVITVVMKAKKIGLQEASDYIGTLCKDLLSDFQGSQREMEALVCKAKKGEAGIFRDAVRVLETYGHLVRGNVEWCFETERYFGKENKNIRKSLLVTLLPENSVSRPLDE